MKTLVYHGSNTVVEHPSLLFGRDDADFGLGFYVTTDFEMAEKWACRKKIPIVNVYEFDTSSLSLLTLNIDAEWLNFVIANRNGYEPPIETNGFDIIIGATADDKMFATMEQYEEGLISETIAIKALNCMKIGNQMCLRTNKCFDNLTFLEPIYISPNRAVEVQKQNAEARKEAGKRTAQIIREANMKKQHGE